MGKNFEEENFEYEMITAYDAATIARFRRIQSTDRKYSVNELIDLNEYGEIFLESEVQRAFTWDLSRRCYLIHTLMLGYPMPQFFINKVDMNGNKILSFLDGKQRITSILKFVDDEYVLKGIDKVLLKGDKIYDPNGKKFSELPEELKKRILNYSIYAVIFDDLSAEQQRIVFKKLNNGKPLSSKEKTIASCIDLGNIANLGSHEFFKDMLTSTQIGKRTQLGIVIKIYLMLFKDMKDIDFGTKTMNQYSEKLESTESERKTILDILDKAKGIYDSFDKKDKKVRKAFCTETHFVSLVPFIQKAIEEGVDNSMFASFVLEYFGDKIPVSEAYNNVVRSSSAKNASIITRHEELTKAWDSFFEVDSVVEEEEFEEEEETEEEQVEEEETEEEDTFTEEDSKEIEELKAEADSYEGEDSLGSAIDEDEQVEEEQVEEEEDEEEDDDFDLFDI